MFTVPRLLKLHEELLAFVDEYGSDAGPAVPEAARVVAEVTDKEIVLAHPEEHVERAYFGRSA